MKLWFFVLALVFGSAADAAPHAHWRVLFTVTGSTDSWFASANEVVFTSGGVQVSTAGGVFTASSWQIGEPREPAFAFDGAAGSLWSTDAGIGGPAWLAVQFPAAVTVDGLSLMSSGTTGRVDRAPEALALEYSDDGATWVTSQAFTASGWADGVAQSFAVTATPPETPASAPASGASAPLTNGEFSAGVRLLLAGLVVAVFALGFQNGGQP